MTSDLTFTGKLTTLTTELSSILHTVGGSKAGAFLDTLASLTSAEQEIVLDTFTKILEKIRSGEERLLTLEESSKEEFFSSLHGEIIAAFTSKKPARLQVISGGKRSLISAR